MKKLILPFLIFCLLALYYFNYKYSIDWQSHQKLVIYTYSSFASSFGPAKELREQFQKKYGIDIQFVDVGEAGLLSSRLMLEGSNGPADIVLGLDEQSAKEIQEKIEFLSYLPEFDWDDDLPEKDQRIKNLMAYSWAPISLIARHSDKRYEPKILEELLRLDKNSKIIFFDPQTSTPGFVVFRWMLTKWGSQKTQNFFKAIKERVLTITPSWSAGYGLFQKGKVQFIFSYITSPIYHRTEENNFDYFVIPIKDSLPYHVEYFGILKNSKHQELAKQFVDFLFSKDAQAVVMNKNFMLPVVNDVKTDTIFDIVKNIKLDTSESHLTKEEVFRQWKEIKW